MSSYDILKCLFLSAYDMVNTASSTNPVIHIITGHFRKFLLILMESFCRILQL